MPDLVPILNTQILVGLFTVFVLTIFVGFQIISKVPPTLHTPLMSGTNAIHGIVLVGAILVTGLAHDMTSACIGVLAMIFAAVNVVGGYIVTDRMLEMFKKKPEE